MHGGGGCLSGESLIAGGWGRIGLHFFVGRAGSAFTAFLAVATVTAIAVAGLALARFTLGWAAFASVVTGRSLCHHICAMGFGVGKA